LACVQFAPDASVSTLPFTMGVTFPETRAPGRRGRARGPRRGPRGRGRPGAGRRSLHRAWRGPRHPRRAGGGAVPAHRSPTARRLDARRAAGRQPAAGHARRVVVDRRPVGPVGAMRTMPPPVRVTPTVIAVGIAVAIGVAVAIPVTDVQATPPAAGIAVDTA